MGLIRMLLSYGKWLEESNPKRDEYDNPYQGEWVNRSRSKFGEKWVWVDREDRSTLYVSIYEVMDDFVIKIEDHPKPYALEIIECHGSREAEIEVRLQRAKYETWGRVIENNSTDV